MLGNVLWGCLETSRNSGQMANSSETEDGIVVTFHTSISDVWGLAVEPRLTLGRMGTSEGCFLSKDGTLFLDKVTCL